MSRAVSETTSCHKQNREQFSYVPLYKYCCILAYCLSYYKCANKWIHKFCTAVVPRTILNWKTNELIKDSNFYGALTILRVMATPQLFCVHTQGRCTHPCFKRAVPQRRRRGTGNINTHNTVKRRTVCILPPSEMDVCRRKRVIFAYYIYKIYILSKKGDIGCIRLLTQDS
jgi:hypothetical protein